MTGGVSTRRLDALGVVYGGARAQGLRIAAHDFFEKAQIPILLIHGTADWRADYEHATRMRDALENAHKDVQFVSLKFEGHGAYDEENRIEVYRTLLDFLSKHLRGGRVPASGAQSAQP